MTTPHRSIRLLSKDSTELNALTGESGEILYDSTSGVLRLYNGSTTGGTKLATQTSLDTKAPIASPTFTGTVTIPAGASISGYATSTQLSTLQTLLAPTTNPEFTGNVGINVSSPQYPLTVNGVANVRDLYMNSQTGAGIVEHNIYMDNAAGTTTVKFTTNGNSYINGGNVLIGTSSPQSGALLTVNGGVYVGSTLAVGNTLTVGGQNIKSLAIAMAAALS